jgi:hypothetical protein
MLLATGAVSRDKDTDLKAVGDGGRATRVGVGATGAVLIASTVVVAVTMGVMVVVVVVVIGAATRDTEEEEESDARVVKEERDLVRLVDVGFFRPTLDLAGAAARAGEAVEALLFAASLEAPPNDSLRIFLSDVGRTGALRFDRVFSKVLNNW